MCGKGDLPCGEQPEGLWIDPVFNLKHSRGKCLGRVARVHGNLPLQHNGAVIILLVNHVYGRTGYRVARCKNGLMHMYAVHPLAAELRQKRRMNIDHPVTVCRDHRSWNPLHVSRECDEIHLMIVQRCQKGVNEKLFVRELTLTEVNGRKSVRPRDLQNPRGRVVAENDSDPDPGQRSRFDRGEDCLEVGPAAGPEHGNIQYDRGIPTQYRKVR